MRIFTIGFTKKSASVFFNSLRRAGIGRLIDVRLHNVSQLAGFAKRDDLEFFLRELCQVDYLYEPLFAPLEEALRGYRDGMLSWDDYAASYNALLREREIDRVIDRSLFAMPAVLLCSEATPEKCHRSLAAEYLAAAWGDVDIVHI